MREGAGRVDEASRNGTGKNINLTLSQIVLQHVGLGGGTTVRRELLSSEEIHVGTVPTSDPLYKTILPSWSDTGFLPSSHIPLRAHVLGKRQASENISEVTIVTLAAF